jgi:hypothetical protein
MSLSYCDHCKENSITIKKNKISDKGYSRIEYCINKGCGYRKQLSEVIINSEEVIAYAKTV